MRMLLVHGRSQGGKDAVKLKSEWLTALKFGLELKGLTLPSDATVDFPFYGDRLDEFVRQFDLPADPAIIPKGSPAFEEFAAFRRDVAVDLQAKAGIPDIAVQAEYRGGTTEKGVENWEWVQAIIRLLDRNITGISQTTIEVFLRDVFLYTRRHAVSSAIDAIVRDMFAENTAVVVGHSLGSVVAYNVLRAAEHKVPFYVSVGSPLAIRAIRKSLSPICNPTGAGGWHNIYDNRDVVALYPLDKNNFDVEPSIKNYGSVQNNTSNRHGIVGYLNDANTAEIIHAAFR
ncbi:hypothetical protein [Bradyrhizobium sp. RT3b]|uniref:hypothetical protein n=1 Tax=Bradyrhizobium sp. RT3b TaxID=3156334 RepID=UPI00339B969A